MRSSRAPQSAHQGVSLRARAESRTHAASYPRSVAVRPSVREPRAGGAHAAHHAPASTTTPHPAHGRAVTRHLYAA